MWESHQALSVNLSSLAPQPLSARYPLSRHSRCHVTRSPHKRLNPLIGPEIPQRFQRRYKGRFSEHRRQSLSFSSSSSVYKFSFQVQVPAVQLPVAVLVQCSSSRQIRQLPLQTQTRTIQDSSKLLKIHERFIPSFNV